jgi:hypothetical protein
MPNPTTVTLATVQTRVLFMLISWRVSPGEARWGRNTDDTPEDHERVSALWS